MSATTIPATPAAEAVARSLAAHTDGITARDLATSAQVGASTAAKILAAMEADGTATRTPGTSATGRKTADIWRPATTDNTTEEPPMTTTDETPATDDTATTDETPATDDATTTDEVRAVDEPTSGDDDGASNRIVESHMAQPGETVHFEVSGDDVTNTGDREAGIFLTAGGTVVADVPVTVTAAEPTTGDSAGTAATVAPVSAVPVSGAPVSGAPSGSADHFKIVMVAGILGDHPDGVNAAVVTEQSGLRAPVVARVLTAMEVAGAAVRKPGGSDDAPELWVRGEADLATVDLANAAPYRECVCSCGHKHRVKTGVTVTARRATTGATGEINTDGSARLGKNGLRNQVEAFMRDLGPGHDVTPGTVGRELGGRSSGACGNAMDKLANRGVLIMTSTAPVKYALADDAPAPTAEVAALMTSPATDDEAADEADNATDDAADTDAGNGATDGADSAADDTAAGTDATDAATGDETADSATDAADDATDEA